MKIVIAGGSGHIGRFLATSLAARGNEVVILSRGTQVADVRVVPWDGRTEGPWVDEVNGCDAVINLAGRSVSCRYTPANLKEMMDSRVESTRVVGAAISGATAPPPVWLQMSTATIYAHRYDATNDEATGVIGGAEQGVPSYWAYSVEIAKAWEATQQAADTPNTRQVALRTAMVMSPGRGGVFEVLLRMTRLGLGGPVAGGAQYVSWIHDADFLTAVEFLLREPALTGPVNVAAPTPLPHRDLMRGLRVAAHVPLGLPATRWMAELGALAMRSDTELLLKSRRVVPGRLLAAGCTFRYPDWPTAAEELVRRA
ncbi:MAG TPA: TIGR01777 family oxidoreductase [Pseudonocardiaceae bacterium]|nr:TIGR01777 family oxidoreductase [Pseudonocardiaceae bacterium]